MNWVKPDAMGIAKVIPEGVCDHCWKCKRKFIDYWDIVSRIRVEKDPNSSIDSPRYYYCDRGGDKRYRMSTDHQQALTIFMTAAATTTVTSTSPDTQHWICVECLTDKQFDEFLEPYLPKVLWSIINAYVGPVDTFDTLETLSDNDNSDYSFSSTFNLDD